MLEVYFNNDWLVIGVKETVSSNDVMYLFAEITQLMLP